MDITGAPPPPSQTGPTSQVGPAVAWWRQPVADLLDVLLVALVGVLVGGAVAAAMLAGSAGDPWAELGAAVLGLGAGLLAAVIAWLVLLARITRGAPTPGARTVRPPDSSVLAAAGRHIAVVVVLWAGTGTLAAAVEPWPAGPIGGALLAAVAAGVALAAWGSGPATARWRTVGVVAITGLLVAGAVPDRAPYSWELQTTATEALVALLDDDPAADRACSNGAVAGLPHASHRSGTCGDPDRVWTVERRPVATAEQLAAEARRAVGGAAIVRWDRRFEELVVTVDDDVVAIVTHRADCTSRVVLARYDSDASGPPTDANCS